MADFGDNLGAEPLMPKTEQRTLHGLLHELTFPLEDELRRAFEAALARLEKMETTPEIDKLIQNIGCALNTDRTALNPDHKWLTCFNSLFASDPEMVELASHLSGDGMLLCIRVQNALLNLSANVGNPVETSRILKQELCLLEQNELLAKFCGKIRDKLAQIDKPA